MRRRDLKGDNEGSVAITKNPEFHQRTEDIEVRWHWVRNLVKEEHISVEGCKGRTKPQTS